MGPSLSHEASSGCVRPRFFREALWPRTDHTGKVCTTSACRPVYRRLTCTYIDLRSSQKFAFIAVPWLSTQFGALKRQNVHCDLAESDRLRPTHTSPPLTPAPIPSAVDPHTVERAWFMASRWSAPLYERPGRPGPRLLGSAWVGGGRDGSSPRTPLRTRCRERRPLHPGAGRSPAGGIALTAGRSTRWSTHGHRPYPHVGARRRSVGGVERSRGLNQ